MPNRTLTRSLMLCSLLSSLPLVLSACATSMEVFDEDSSTGELSFDLKLAEGVDLTSVSYAISGNGFAKADTVGVTESTTLRFKVGGIPAGAGYLISLTASGPSGSGVSCTGSASFDIASSQTTTKNVHLQCKLPKKGSLLVTGDFNICPTVDDLSVLPEEVTVGGTIELIAAASDADALPGPLSYHWIVDGGTLSSATTATTTLTCTEAGDVNITLSVGDTDCDDVVLTTVTCSPVDGSAGEAILLWNEVESSGGTPGDWAEIYNAGLSSADLAGWTFKDNDDTHAYVLPAGSTLAPGAYLVLEEAAFGFGLGGAESVRLFRPDGTLAIDYSWLTHAPVTYGRCPNGSGEFTATAAATKGSTNTCAVPVTFNEVESSGGTPGDWVELVNAGSTPSDLSGYIFRDSDDTHAYTLPAGTIVAPGAYLVLEEAAFGFGLGGGDSVRLFTPGGALVEAYSYLDHAATTYGRCPNATGAFGVTTAPSKGLTNSCPLDPNVAAPWPGSPDVLPVDAANAFPTNLSGLHYQPPAAGEVAVLWAALNSPSKIYRLVHSGVEWTPEAGAWAAGKLLQYPGGVGQPDTESVTKAEWGSVGLYAATERNNELSSTSRLSVLRSDETAAGGTLVATNEWNLTAELPVVGSNLGFEAITWLPDSYLVASGFRDGFLGKLYDPSDYPDHGTGLFALGVEGTGSVHLLALDHASDDANIVATISSGQVGVMALEFDRDSEVLWAGCDDTCGNQVTLLSVGATGEFGVRARFAKPSGLPNSNNEGLAFVSEAECSGGTKAIFWADDANFGSHALRQGTVNCGPLF